MLKFTCRKYFKGISVAITKILTQKLCFRQSVMLFSLINSVSDVFYYPDICNATEKKGVFGENTCLNFACKLINTRFSRGISVYVLPDTKRF